MGTKTLIFGFYSNQLIATEMSNEVLYERNKAHPLHLIFLQYLEVPHQSRCQRVLFSFYQR